jgi:hypothetical protein
MMLPRSAFGLGIRSNADLAALRRAPRATRVDVSLHLQGRPDGVDPLDESEWVEFHRSKNVCASRHTLLDFHCLRYVDGTVVVVDGAGRRVWSVAPRAASVEDTGTYLLGPAMGFVLRLRGLMCLHASAAVTAGRAVAIIGRSGAGKSTLAAAFALRKDSVITDDVLALAQRAGRFEAQPAYPRVRLWPESVAGLFSDPEALPRITPGWDKRYLDLTAPGFRFQRDAVALSAVYLLDDLDTPQSPRIEPMRAREALLALAAHTYAGQFMDRTRRAAEFDTLARLVERVPVRRALRHVSFDSLEPLCAAIQRDAAALAP